MMRKLRAHELQRLDASHYRAIEKLPLVIVLDHVRSLNNIGSIFRTSDAYLVEKIILCGICGTPPHHDIHKTALGAEDVVEWEYVEDTLQAVEALKKEHYTTFAVEQAEGSLSLCEWTAKPGEKYAFVLGNEVRGVQQAVIDACDHCIELPQFGTKHSLNVSITGGIIIWEAFRKMKKHKA